MPIIDKSTVSLRFTGEGLNQDELYKRLVFFPIGETIKPSVKTRGKNIIVSIGYREVDSVDMGKKIEILLDCFTKDLTIWKEISKNYKGNIFCGLFLDGWNRGLELSKELLKAISDRNLFISFDIYSPTDSWDEDSY